MYTLRSYQQEAVDKTLHHFRKTQDPAVIVLPTGAGKSLVIAELANIASGNVLVLAHVKELVEQNHQKFETYGSAAAVYSAGLGRKETKQKVTFGSIQSVARADTDFFHSFSILIIDECHRISLDKTGQYAQVISKLQKINKKLCILGLTATPYRMGMGWIYNYSCQNKLRTNQERLFKKCIFDLSLSYMIKNNYLTPPIQIDSPVASYDFSNLKLNSNGIGYSNIEIDEILKDQSRITPSIIKNILEMSEDRKGVMIFTSTIRHAQEIVELLPKEISNIILGETINRDEIIQDFKKQKIKFLVNVSVLTTGFDAPHVDLIAILRPTESVSLFQQIVGRGLRLSPGKEDCLILDYTGLDHNIFKPEIGEDKPTTQAVPVEVLCPDCGHENNFWAIVNEDGDILEHFGRTCQGGFEVEISGQLSFSPCGFKFRFKRCEKCNHENDVSARECVSCNFLLIDTDTKLKEAMSLKDAHVMRPDTMTFEMTLDKKGTSRLEVRYYDLDAEYLSEYFYLNSPADLKAFYYNFTRMHTKLPGLFVELQSSNDIIQYQKLFKIPKYLIARKKKYFWAIREKIF